MKNIPVPPVLLFPDARQKNGADRELALRANEGADASLLELFGAAVCALALAAWAVLCYRTMKISQWLKWKRVCAWHPGGPRWMGGNPLARRRMHGVCRACLKKFHRRQLSSLESRFNELAIFNNEVSRGIPHIAEMRERMEKLQAAYNAEVMTNAPSSATAAGGRGGAERKP